MLQEAPTGFNLQVTHRDEKTGLITHQDPYILRIVQSESGGKTRLWERPKGSGNLFDKKGEPIGRWEVDAKTGKGSFKKGMEHIAFVAPLTADQKLAQSLIEKDEQLRAMQAELEQIRAENKKRES